MKNVSQKYLLFYNILYAKCQEESAILHKKINDIFYLLCTMIDFCGVQIVRNARKAFFARIGIKIRRHKNVPPVRYF